MNIPRKYIFIASIAMFATTAGAQTLHSSYFLEGNNERHTLNPALIAADSTGFVTFPVLGGLNISANSNIGLGAVMQPHGDEMVTFMHESISSDEALSRFKNTNIVEANLDVNIITVGFKAWNGMNTVGISVRSNTGLYLPKTMFEFLKNGQNPSGITEYDFSNVRAKTLNYVEVALGHARKINDKLSVGAKLKVLLGGAFAEAHADDVEISMSDSRWLIKQNSSLIASKGMNLITDASGEITDVDFDDFGVAGMGGAIDLGAVYKINDKATVSLAVTDLGFINWKDCSYATNKNDSFEFEGFDNIAVEDNPDGSNSFDDAADQVWESLKGMVKYNSDGKKGKTTMLYSTIRAAGEYGVLNNKISFGLLASMRLGAPELWTELMATANFRPSKWFNAAVNGSWSNVHSSLGAVINFHPKAVNFFIGGDYLLAKYSKQFIPVDAAKLNVGLGLSFNF